MTDAPYPYRQLVFSGGGLRCFWHGGFLEAFTETRALRPDRITGSSGGALSAAAWVLGAERRLRDMFADAMAGLDSNVTLDDLGSDDGRSVHQRTYDAILDKLLDASALARIAEGPAFQINVATPGTSRAPTARALLGGTIYQAEQLLSPTPRPRLSTLAGMEQRLIDARQAAQNGTLADLIRMAATVPPAFRPDDWNGETIFDGGMVDKAPMPDPDDGPTLVLLTKRFHALPDDENGRITFVEPGEDILPGRKLDFTDPGLLVEAWDQGRDDGRRWRNKIA
ncbi:patatin-like phospholipase family protein [Jannaschia pohangensis]|uniref:Patatin-like phospholipase n=1 Tax=Jannaschia pohangensis TaxID=390807 RepID=A0A1I3MSB6_9RHOB|nr:patatin-like phospholipase family protein [Jannaschia pohangensis]SFI99839.1 Patatin-like phospholipase [Jannaschia pohangensis]